jgi:hypothetical protein
MALALLAGLYILAGSLVYLLTRIDISNDELRLAINVLAGIGALILPIAVYSAIDFRLTRAAVERIGRNWCAASGFEFLRTEMHKNHFSVIYKTSEKKRQSFRVRFVPTTWIVKGIEWL